jgi:uncharacterized protein YjbJ (UPF0337 family)
MSMNQDRFSGTGKNFGGYVEEGFGRVAGDVKTQVEGKMKQPAGGSSAAWMAVRAASPAALFTCP